MGTISSGVGLISGLNIQDIVSKLMEIESKPLKLLETRIQSTQQQQLAYSALNAQISAVRAAVQNLNKTATYRARSATSSNAEVLAATAGDKTPIGNYTFTVRSLVSAHQLVSRGYRDATSAIGAGTLTLEAGQGHVAPGTSLSVLNDGAGVRRGSIRITDRAGGTADVDLTGALTLTDVVNAINSQSSIAVQARAENDHLVLEDTSGGTGTLRIAEVGAGHTAEDLGILGSAADTSLTGTSIYALSANTRLSRLNDGIGVRYAATASDLRFNLADGSSFDVDLSDNLAFSTRLTELNDGNGVRLGTIRITNRRGESAEVDLTGATTVQEVKTRIDDAGLDVRLSSISGRKLVITDNTGAEDSNLKIEDVTGYAAADLGIAQDVEESSFSGAEVYRLDTIGAVLRAIQYAAGNDGRLSVAIAGNGLSITDNTSGAFITEVENLNGSLAARDLGFADALANSQTQTRDLLAGLDTVLLASLNGGQGLNLGTLDLTLRDGTSLAGLDLSGAQTLAQAAGVLNATGQVRAEVDGGGTRLRLTDLTAGTGTFTAAGDAAATLGLRADGDGQLVSDDLQLQYIAENTLLASLNGRTGIAYGSFRITTASGAGGLVRLTEGLHKTVGDVINEINKLNLGVTARINDTGDGIALIDTTTGTGKLTVAEEGSTTAASLKILGTGDATGTLAGSFAAKIALTASDNLTTLATKINQAKIGVTASVINDGTGETPYRLVISSALAGSAGRLAFSGDIPGFNLNTLSEARDATMVIGDASSPNAILISNSSNTFENIVSGLTVTALSASGETASINVEQDIDTAVTAMQGFISSYNQALDALDQATDFNAESETRGLLQGDGTARILQDRMFRLSSIRVSDDEVALSRLAELGITLRSASLDNPAPRLSMDEEKFRKLMEEKPEQVEKLLTLVRSDEDGEDPVYVGIAARMNQELESLTTQGTGLITTATQRLQQQVDLYNKRAEALQELLDSKEARLYAQFQAMESALADLQGQQSALTQLSNMASSLGSLSLG